MIPMLIVYLIKKMRKASFFSSKIKSLKKLILKIKVLLLLLAVSNLYGNNTNPSNQIKYQVVKNNEVIGTIRITCITEQDDVTYTLESNIKAKYILKFNISGKETSKYKKGVLVYSSVYRKLNKKVKANHTIVYKDDQYYLKQSNNFKPLKFNKILQNLVTLYFKEPKGLTTIFCDNLQQMVKLQPLGNGKYKVNFTNGKYNVFHYKNGKCIKIEARSTLFNVTLIPVES